jgi:peptide/nickel transport system substrate-binding protein
MNRRQKMRLVTKRRAFVGGALAGATLLASLVGFGRAAAQDTTIVLAEIFGARAGWALETDDAYVLTKAGCLEMLTRVDFDGTLKPGLAVSWTQTAPTTWDFTLRPDVRFADGAPLDAAAVVGALNRALHVAAPARAFSPRLVSAVTAVDQRTVRITTPSPSALVPLRMASPNTGILSPAAYQGERINPIRTCTGPFTAVEDVPRQALRLERNPNYWGGPVGYARAELRYVPDGQVRATMAQTGEAQIATVLPVTELRQPPRTLNVVTTDLTRVTSLYLNDAVAPFSDVRVRQAIQAALDTSAIAASVYEGLAGPAVGPFVPGHPWAPAGAAPVTRDLARARSLLAAAGVQPSSIRFELLIYSERPELPDLASVIQAQLGELGITVTIRNASYSSLEGDVLAGHFQAMLLSRNHLTDVPDPGAYLTADYTCHGTYNISHFCEPALDARLEEAVALPDSQRRFAVYAEIATQLQRDAASVFLIRERQRDAVSASVGGYRTHPLGHYILTRDLTPAR